MWIDVLLQAGVEVEECRVVERGSETITPKKEKKRVGRPPKRKRPADEEDKFYVESEEEEEVNYSQLDVELAATDLDLPPPKKPPPRKAATRAEVVITASPIRVCSPTKRRRQARSMSPEV